MNNFYPIKCVFLNRENELGDEAWRLIHRMDFCSWFKPTPCKGNLVLAQIESLSPGEICIPPNKTKPNKKLCSLQARNPIY